MSVWKRLSWLALGLPWFAVTAIGVWIVAAFLTGNINVENARDPGGAFFIAIPLVALAGMMSWAFLCLAFEKSEPPSTKSQGDPL